MSTKTWQKILPVLLLAGMLFCLSQTRGVHAMPQAHQPDEKALAKVEPQLLKDISVNGTSDFIVRFVEQANLSPAYSMTWKERGEFVYNTLKAVADRSQAKAISYLFIRGLGYQSFFAGNDLYVKAGDRAAVESLAALSEVASIRAPRTYQLDPAQVKDPALDFTWVGELVANNIKPMVIDPANVAPQATVDWGITDTHAQDFWSTFGFKGDGIVVANIDTGVQWDHPALIDSYKCSGDPGNPACWEDPTSNCGGAPCDAWPGVWHGTHTMGTMVANDDPALPYIAGMAPNAEWIACLGCPNGGCPDINLNTCADWLLAPGGDPANRPNVVNNSWGDGGGNDWYKPYVQAWVASGIFPAFSAGNNYSCNSLGSPGDYQESFASAAHQSSRAIADFSSKGPSFFGDDPYTKPNISAPGQDIWSTIQGGWGPMSGTSMASPHSAGAVALLWSCNPDLIGQIDQTFQILQNNSDTPPPGSCGAPADGEGNYTYGYGYLNVLAAGMLYCGGPDFTLTAAPETQDICASSEAVYTATLGVFRGFAQSVTLSALGQPTGSTATFVPNALTPPGDSVLTLSNLGGAVPGPYNIAITGAAITQTHTVTVGLMLYATAPGVPALLAPAAETRNVPVRPTFTWQAQQGKEYDIEIATDPNFNNVVDAALALQTASYTPAANLPYNTVLYWHVLAHNACGESAWSATQRFVTEATLWQCALGTTPNVVLTQDFENINPAGWTTGGVGSTWASSLTRKHGGSRSYKATDVDTVSDQWLISPAFSLPAGQAPEIVSFWGYRKFQPSGGFDGGVVEISTDGGSTWNSLDGSLKAGGYDGAITSSTNPLYGKNAWTKPETTWINTIANLDAYAGQTVMLSFRLGTDDSIGYEGWYVDDVAVQACQPSTTLGPDSTQSAMPGYSAVHSFVLANHSTAADSFALTTSGNNWPTTLLTSSPITLTAGQTTTVQVQVDVPQVFTTTTDAFLLTATSQGIPGIAVEAAGATHVAAEASVAVSAAQASGGQAGQVIAYTFTITNTGNTTDTFTLATSGTWLSTLPGGNNTGPMAAGQSVTVTVLVTIPAGALPGQSDVITLTATSMLNNTVSADGQATTMAYYRSYLPVMKK